MSPTHEPMTTGEIVRTLDRLAAQVTSLRAELQPVITRDAADAERFKVIERRLDVLESWQTWGARLVLGAIVIGLLSLVYTL